MSVNRFPEPGPKSYPFGGASLYTLPNTIGQGVYKVNVSGSQSFAASLNALTLRSSAGYEVPVALNETEGFVTSPWVSNGVRVASLSTPTVLDLERISYNVQSGPTFVGASFDQTTWSGSYVINVTLPAGAQRAFLYYVNGTREELGSTFPASVSSPKYDPRTASVMNFILTHVDAYGVESLATTASVSVPTPPGAVATGGTVYNSGGYRYHKFTTSGTLTVTYPGPLEYLVIAGGGGGGDGENNSAGGGGGGGGAGGMVTGSASVVVTNYTITVGGGGAGSTVPSTVGAQGNTSSFVGVASASAAGGGGGGGDETAGGSGGSGGGTGGDNASAGGAGISGQGSNGGAGVLGARAGGGGGGKAEAGNVDGNGHGGDGSNSASVWATATSSGVSGFFAGGGGGGRYSPVAPGGDGGGGAGGLSPNGSGTAGTANTGGGGGGAASGYTAVGAAGGSGIVIIRYVT